MPLEYKIAVVCRKGTLLGTGTEGEHVLVLYHMNDFFIQVRYSPEQDKLVQVQGFTSKRLLEPYLNSIELPRL